MPQQQGATATATVNASPSSLLSLVPRSVILANLRMTATNGVAATKLDKKILLQSICRYLKNNGFSKTVKKLKSEAKLDEDEIADNLILDLDEICSKHFESIHATKVCGKTDQDVKANGNTRGFNADDSNDERGSKKKKKVKNDDVPTNDLTGLKNSDAKPTTEVITESKGKSKDKKKSKKSSDIANQEIKAEDNAPKGESETEKKKMKGRTKTDVTTEKDEENYCDAVSEKHQKSKRKSGNDTEDSAAGTKESKKRKRDSTEDDGDKVVGASLDIKTEHIKREEVKGKAYVAKNAEAKLGDANSGDEVTNSNNGDTPTARKSTKKPRNGSAEPTTIKAFQRVKVDEVVIKDERLKDNSYWAKDGAESGYGAKAQEILGQVRGKDFRHEKTKKKRGSYRGGHIDFDSHSIKFNDSDDE